MAATIGAGDIFRLVHKTLDVGAVQAHTRKPFRFLLCGDPALVAAFRALLLGGHEGGEVPFEAAATLETIVPERAIDLRANDARCIIFLGRRGDAGTQTLSALKAAQLPIFAVSLDEGAQPSGPVSAPARATWAEYVVPSISRDAFKGRLFVHLVECCKGVEIAVGIALDYR